MVEKKAKAKKKKQSPLDKIKKELDKLEKLHEKENEIVERITDIIDDEQDNDDHAQDEAHSETGHDAPDRVQRGPKNCCDRARLYLLASIDVARVKMLKLIGNVTQENVWRRQEQGAVEAHRVG